MLACVVAATGVAASAYAQDITRVSGAVRRAVSDSTVPFPSVWVVLHRVGNDGGAALDSTRADAAGRYRLNFRPTPDSAIYFASTVHAGVAYFTSPFRRGAVSEEDAEIVVFDTTSTGVDVATRSRHVIVFLDARTDVRRLSEVYWIENPGSLTRVAGASGASWRLLLPTGASNLAVNDGDFPRDAVSLREGYVQIATPLSPGLHQLQIAYDVPSRSFPLALPVTDSLVVLEVLIEGGGGEIVGAGLAEQEPVTVEQRSFQRFLAASVAAGAVAEIRVAGGGVTGRTLYVSALVALVGIALVLGIGRGMLRASSSRSSAAVVPKPVGARGDELARQIAALDARFERIAHPTEAERAAHRERRRELEAELTTLLAERDDQL